MAVDQVLTKCAGLTPLHNTINSLHQALPCFCHVTLLTFHVIMFAECSQFSISQARPPPHIHLCLPDSVHCLEVESHGYKLSKTLVAGLPFSNFLFQSQSLDVIYSIHF